MSFIRKCACVVVVIFSFTSCYKETGESSTDNPVVVGPTVRGDNLGMGNPSGAETSLLTPNNYLMVKPQYTLSYNSSRGGPNWVSWHLNSTWIGKVGRVGEFAADNSLPSGWYVVSEYAFSGSGFDRGHMCPSADRTASVSDNYATFLMTNMIPQAPNNNQKVWAYFENYCRGLAEKGMELYIIAGGSGTGGSGSSGYKESVNGGHVVVPKYTWKVVLVLPNGDDDISRVTAQARTIAIWIPNEQNVSELWTNYIVSVDDVEQRTGLDFFSKVPVNIQSIIEAKVDAGS